MFSLLRKYWNAWRLGAWEYGIHQSQVARRHRIKGTVQVLAGRRNGRDNWQEVNSMLNYRFHLVGDHYSKTPKYPMGPGRIMKYEDPTL